VWGGVADVPTKVSSSMAQNLSVPIMFVCLLHLANEKHLKISSTEAMDELMVVQG
jgi:condensin complex subunit 2